MVQIRIQVWWISVKLLAVISILLGAGSVLAQNNPEVHEGAAVSIGNGSAHTVIRTDAKGEPVSIGVVFTPGILEGLPTANQGEDPNFPYLLLMPTTGPKTVIDHVVINWESEGHPPANVYDVQHFDFHFYLVSQAEQMKVTFSSSNDSADPSQLPAPELVPQGYIMPPGTAVSGMGVHAINPTTPEFQHQPFTATLIYGYYNQQQTFIEPMVSLEFLLSKPSFSASVPRPAAYTKPGAYPSTYAINFDAANNVYEVSLKDIR
ncbi:DUF5602 domain-containing protein [uncultured Amphritea sp.]|uniref:DUF5602 domain-containing protein n=1 Tax=uncultured Amphritea sp. TaxID=981605 RepID=UPI0025F06987|nr:DUF5602 domain-containing protein [uncultured Amphritea sp.]